MMPSDLRDLSYAFARGISEGAFTAIVVALAIIGILISILEINIGAIFSEIAEEMSSELKATTNAFSHSIGNMAKELYWWTIGSLYETGIWLGMAWKTHYGLTRATAFTGIYFLVIGALMLTYLPLWS